MGPLIAVLAVDVTVQLYWLQGGGKTVTLPIEEYVAGVLAGEAAGMKSPESMKAMAVAARTYAIRNRGRHQKEGFDFCDTTHCQDLRISAIQTSARVAATATEGELLWRDGALADALYSKNCGGMTESGIADPYCPRDDWRRKIRESELGGDVAVIWRTPGKRVAQIRVAGRPMSGADFHLMIGRKLGWDRLPSTWFSITRAGDTFIFDGRGHGHGIGLCQDGCARMGESGKDYRKILAFYFPRAVTGTSASGISWRATAGERVDVFAARAEPDVVAFADKSLAEAEALTGMRTPGRPRLWFYPTVAAFRDATGRGGEIAATTNELTIRLQPIGTLRARNSLHRTIGHELLHAVLESNTSADHPWWFREGLVLCLNHENPSDPRYREAETRVSRLLSLHGRETILGWWKSGLPRDAAPSGIEQRPRESEAKKSAY